MGYPAALALPETPETYYLMELLATHDFQTGLQNYLDLADMRRKLLAWQASFDSFDDMVDIRHDHYEPLLPDIDREFRELDSQNAAAHRAAQNAGQASRRPCSRRRGPNFSRLAKSRRFIARLERVENQLAGLKPRPVRSVSAAARADGSGGTLVMDSQRPSITSG